MSNSNAYISGCSTCPTVTVVKNADYTNVDLIADISHCSFSYQRSKTVTLGFAPLTGIFAAPMGADTAYPNSHYTYIMYYPMDYPPPSFYWEVPSGWTILMGQGTYTIYVKTGGMGTSGPVEIDITACGVTRPLYKYVEIGFGSDWPDALPPEESKGIKPKLGLSPNPSHDKVMLSLITADNDKAIQRPVIQAIKVTDKMDMVRKMIPAPRGQYSYVLDVADLPHDVYIVSVFDGSNWYNAPLVVK